MPFMSIEKYELLKTPVPCKTSNSLAVTTAKNLFGVKKTAYLVGNICRDFLGRMPYKKRPYIELYHDETSGIFKAFVRTPEGHPIYCTLNSHSSYLVIEAADCYLVLRESTDWRRLDHQMNNRYGAPDKEWGPTKYRFTRVNRNDNRTWGNPHTKSCTLKYCDSCKK